MYSLELSQALRGLRRRPGFSCAVATTLALATALLTATLTVVNAVVIRPLPFDSPTQLFDVAKLAGDGAPRWLSVLELEDWQTSRQSFDTVAGSTARDFTVVGGRAEALIATLVSHGYLEMLGAAPARGRLFGQSEYAAGGERVVLLTHGFWLQRYNADPSVVGGTIDLEGPRS